MRRREFFAVSSWLPAIFGRKIVQEGICMGTIRDLNELTTPAATDYLLVADTSDLVDKDKKMLMSKVVMKSGTPLAGHAATWLDANTLQDGGVVGKDRYLESAVLLVDAAFTTNAATKRFATMSAAMAACVGGETVQVAPGIYNENVTFASNGVKLIGSGAPS